MAASAVIRVKRSRDEKPLEALIVSCKRQKCDSGDVETPINTVLTFAGTVQNQEENVHSQLSKALKDVNTQASFKAHIPNVKEKLREDVKTKQQNDRFKVINFYRSSRSGDANNEQDGEMVVTEDLTVFDIESQPSEEPGCSADGGDRSEDFEYDLYYAASASATDLSFGVLNGNLSVQPYDLVPDVWPEGEGPDFDSEDSNDENNWRNDYPEEEEDDEDKERSDWSDDDGLYRRMARCGLGEVELSSDDDDENLPYEKSRRRYEAHLELSSSSSSEESEGVAEED